MIQLTALISSFIKGNPEGLERNPICFYVIANTLAAIDPKTNIIPTLIIRPAPEL
jgi:hypothetical protein